MEKITERDLAELHYLMQNKSVKAKDLKDAKASIVRILDIDGDGELTEKDVKALKKFLATGEGIDKAVADVNGDGVVNMKDVAALKKAIEALKEAE